MTDTLIRLGFAALSVLLVLAWGLLLQGITRKIAARVGRRVGIRLFQPYIDLVKNYLKTTAVHHGVMFWLGPVFRLTGGIGVLLFLPVIAGSTYFANFSFAGDVILVLYFIFFGTLGMALGAGESGHPFAAIGVARGLAQVTVAELPMTLAVLALAIQYKTLSVADIVAAQQGGILHWTVLSNPLAVMAGMLAYLGTMGRSPFNVVLAPQEIPIGPPTEFHSAFLGVLQTNRAIFPLAKTVLYMNLFFGGAQSWPELMLKTFLIYMTTVVVGVSFPRFRVDQSIRWFVQVPLALGLLAVLLGAR